MKMGKGKLKSVLALFSLCLAFSCQQQHSPTDSEKNTLHLNITTEPPTLDPRQVSDSVSIIVLESLFEGLMRQTPDGKIVPGVAQDVMISPDKKTYTFILKDTYWSNGDPVTAEDFEYAWKWMADPKQAAESVQKFYMIKNGRAVKTGKLPISELGIHAQDPKTLVVELEYPTPYLLELLSRPYFFPVHRKTAERNPQWSHKVGPDYISNGPYLIKTWEHHNRIALEKNPRYWDAESVKIPKIDLLMIEDNNTELSMFEKGELDWAGSPISIGLPTDAIPALLKSGRMNTISKGATYVYLFNVDKVPLNNVKVRKALSYAIDRTAIVTHILQAGQQPALGLMPSGMALQSEPYFQDHDLAKARELLAEGLAELGLTVATMPPIVISYNTSEAHHKIAQAIQQQWNEAFHIPVTLENLEWKVYLDKLMRHDYMVARLGWVASFQDPIALMELFEEKDSAENPTGWENARFRELIELSRSTVDLQERKEHLHEAEKLLMEEMPFIPIYFYTSSYMVNPRLKGIYFNPLGDVSFRWAYFED